MFLTSDILHARNSWTPSSMVFKQHTFPDSKNSFCTILALEYGSAAGAPSPPLGIRINWEFYKYRWGWGFEGAHLATRTNDSPGDHNEQPAFGATGSDLSVPQQRQTVARARALGGFPGL